MFFIKPKLAGIAAFALAMTGLCFTLRVAWANWVSKSVTKESIQAAIRMVPDNWKYYRDWGEFVPADGLSALRGAVLHNPQNPMLRLELAEIAEKAGRSEEAEANLRTAVALDRTAGPRTLLAEFYFRQRDEPHFWPAAQAALAVAASGPVSLFQHGWALSQNGGILLERAIPEKPEILTDYLEFLVNTGRLDAAERVAARLMKAGTEAPRVLMKYDEAMVREGRVTPAVEAWNWLAARKLIPYAALGPNEKKWITDQDWSTDPEAAPGIKFGGFSWELTRDVFAEYLNKDRELRIRFSGKQPEKCDVLTQNVALWPGRKYWLRVKYQTRGVGAESGLSWRVTLRDGTVLSEAGMPGGSSKEFAEKEVTTGFAGPTTPTIGRLVLAYARAAGTVRIEGEVALRQVDGGWE